MSTRMQPNPDQPDRCPSIDPLDTLQCGRRIHDDDQCQFGGIAWKKGEPPYVSDRERANRLEAMCDRLAEKADGYLSRLQRVEAIAARLESKDRGRPGVIGWMPASVLATDIARDLRAALEKPSDIIRTAEKDTP